MERWVGKTALVTGASAGIGAEIAVSLANAGMVVVAAARRIEKLTEIQNRVSGEGRVIPIVCDVTNEDEVVKMIDFAKKHAGGIDVLVNNAGSVPVGTITDCNGLGASLKAMVDCVKINVIGVITTTRLAVDDMTARKAKGHVIMINSTSGHRTTRTGEMEMMSVYGATKFAVTELTEALRLEFGYSGNRIRITSISPGSVDTQLLRSIPGFTDTTPMLKTNDIAEAVIYALSAPDNVNITELTIQPVGEIC